jgi:hypothetical protein
MNLFPTVKYYRFDDEWRKITSLIDAYQAKAIYVDAFNWQGKRYTTCSKTIDVSTQLEWLSPLAIPTPP